MAARTIDEVLPGKGRPAIQRSCRRPLERGLWESTDLTTPRRAGRTRDRAPPALLTGIWFPRTPGPQVTPLGLRRREGTGSEPERFVLDQSAPRNCRSPDWSLTIRPSLWRISHSGAVAHAGIPCHQSSRPNALITYASVAHDSTAPIE
jgi:hypothetical protein